MSCMLNFGYLDNLACPEWDLLDETGGTQVLREEVIQAGYWTTSNSLKGKHVIIIIISLLWAIKANLSFSLLTGIPNLAIRSFQYSTAKSHYFITKARDQNH